MEEATDAARAATTDGAVTDRRASVRAELKELCQDAEARLVAAREDPAAHNPQEVMGELGEFVELLLFLSKHGADFTNQLKNTLALLQLAQDPAAISAIQNSMPGTLDRTSLMQQAAPEARKLNEFIDLIMETYELGRHRCGEDGDLESLKDRIAVFRPILKLHRETCKECKPLFARKKDEEEKEGGEDAAENPEPNEEDVGSEKQTAGDDE